MAIANAIYLPPTYMAIGTVGWTKFCVGCFLCVSFAVSAATDFISVNILPDGEVETRVHYNGISAKETSVSNNNRKQIKYRQLTDGRHFIQLIYENDTIKDCEYVRQKDKIISFLSSFREDLRNAVSTSNLTTENLDGKPLPTGINTWLHYPKLRKLCRRTHRKMKERTKRLQRVEQEFELNYGRSKNPRHSFLLLPGTVWCGHSDVASRYTDLGQLGGTDRCCRRHDNCRMNIHGFTKKYNFYNLRPFTVSHCHCDASFRACLKMVGTSDANMVGKIFFNVVQTKCFVLKPKKLCTGKRRGKRCAKRKHSKQAILRDNLSY